MHPVFRFKRASFIGAANHDADTNLHRTPSLLARRSSAPLLRRWTLLVFGLLLPLQFGRAADDPAFIRLMNAGKAYLENRNSADATEAFTAAVERQPRSVAALRNLARALMLAKDDGTAIETLRRAAALEKDSPAINYLFGLAHAHQSNFREAVPYLEEAVRLDPHTPALRFQLGNAYQLVRESEKALTQFKETIRLDPLHASAQFKLATFAIRAGNRAEYNNYHAEFTRLRKIFGDDARTPAALERCAYTRPEPAPEPPPQPAAAIRLRFTDATESFLPDAASRAAVAAAVMELSTNGQPELIVLDEAGRLFFLRGTPQHRYVRTAVNGLAESSVPARAPQVGNFADVTPAGTKYDPALHARNDLLLAGPRGVRLLQRIGPDTFSDVTKQAGLAGVTATQAAWADYEHDGDIDLCLATTNGLHLWQNNGNGTFSNVTASVGIQGSLPATDVAAIELDSNGAVDLLVARNPAPTQVVMNQRAGRFAERPSPPGPLPPAHRIAANDLDNDGELDTVLLSPEGLTVLFGRSGERRQLPDSDSPPDIVALFDFDNDGWLDIAVARSSGTAANNASLRLWRNSGRRQFRDVTGDIGFEALRFPKLHQVLPVDLDIDGDTDLLLVTADGTLRALRNDGGDRNRQLKVVLLGTKTNPMGIGSLVEVRAGAFRVTRWVCQLPLEIGLGQQTQLDSIRTIWTNGIEDNQIRVTPAPGAERITEKNVAAGSCPYLYAWDGKGFRFVTDLLGNSPIGLSLRRGVFLPADPDEFVLVGDAQTFPPRNGAYELEITDELRELLYLDEARLVAIDHPPDVEIHSTDKLGPPPFPASELWGLRNVQAPTRATGSDGIDRTAALAAIDQLYAPPGPILPPPLRGQCAPLELTLEFAPIDTTRQWVLALTGWIQYGDASVNIAASQRSELPVIPPRLEAAGEDGQWKRLDVIVGMPAGKTKTILCDLKDNLPHGCTRLRLTTTFELRWDRVALAERVDPAQVLPRTLPLQSAYLYWRGFSDIRPRGPGHPFTPSYADVSHRPPWSNTPQGWCTRYGDVRFLVESRDDRLAILNGGDALKLRFPAEPLPPVSPGTARTFALYTVGWDKDQDNNVETGDTVEPLPVAAPGHWALEYNTRWVPGDRFP